MFWGVGGSGSVSMLKRYGGVVWCNCDEWTCPRAAQQGIYFAASTPQLVVTFLPRKHYTGELETMLTDATKA